MDLSWTETQRSRLIELDADGATMTRRFADPEARDRAFQEAARVLVRTQRGQLAALRDGVRRPRLCRLESRLVERLVGEGFVQVTTPLLMSRGMLAKMGVTADHPLAAQIYWVGTRQCLRPMLAPHLYEVVQHLLRLWERPVRVFEVGTCFRKETRGNRHAAEFTMLNLCEFGLSAAQRRHRLEALTALVMAQAGIAGYRLESEPSAVYGSTVDVMVGTDGNGMEVGSAAMGPHALDRAWRITEPWVGIGFGLERLLMAAEGATHLGRFARSLAYLDGMRLNI